MLRNFWNDQNGFVISAELVLVLTIGVLSMIVGLNEVAVAVNTELNDISNAFGALNQSFAVTGFSGADGKIKSVTSGTVFHDTADDCDTNSSCNIVIGVPGPPPVGAESCAGLGGGVAG